MFLSVECFINCVKSVRIRSFSGPFFPVFALNTEIRIRTEYGDLLCKSPYSIRMRENTDQKTPNTDTFYAVINFEL